MKKLLFCIFDLNGGGAEKVLVNLLERLDPKKYDVTLLTIFGVGVHKDRVPTWIKQRSVFSKQFKGFTTIMKLFSPKLLHRLFVGKQKYDLEIAYLETSPTRLISGAPKGTKKVAWVHVQEETPDTFKSIYRSRSEMINAYNSFEAIACVSKFIKQSFTDNHPVITTPKKVIYNVVDLDRMLSLGKEEWTVLDESKLNIVSVGRLTKQKGYLRLLSIVNRLNMSGFKDEFQLYILGCGEDREKMENYIEENDLMNVHLLGFQENPYKIVSKMDCFVCSSYKEGYYTAVNEAVKLGVPVVTTETSGMDEILQDGKFGMIVPNDEEKLFDALKKVIEDPKQLEKYRKEIRISNTDSTNYEMNEQFIDSFLK